MKLLSLGSALLRDDPGELGKGLLIFLAEVLDFSAVLDARGC